jgi:hypothetical protein
VSVRLRILFESIKNESWNSYYMWELFWLSFFMLTLPEDLEKYLPKYKINFVDAERLTNVEEFSEDLQVILAMLRYRNSREEGEGKHECSRSFR